MMSDIRARSGFGEKIPFDQDHCKYIANNDSKVLSL